MPLTSWLEIGALVLTIGIATLIGWGLDTANEPGALAVEVMSASSNFKG